MIKTNHLFTRRLLPSLIAGVVAASANGAGDEVISDTLIGEQLFINDSTSITVQSGGSINSTGFNDGISLDDAGGHNLTFINVDVEAVISAGWDAIYTGEGDVTIGSITIAGDLLSTSVPGGIGVTIDSGTTVTGDVMFTTTGTFIGSGAGLCEGGSTINCGIVQAAAVVIGTVDGDLVNQGTTDANNGLSVAGLVELTTGNSVAGALGGNLLNSGDMTVDGDAGLFVFGGASVGGNVENSGNITATGTAAGIKVTNIAANYDDTVNVDDIDGFIAGSVQTVVSGDVINSGAITGISNGIVISDNALVGGNISNSGDIISASGTAIFINNGTLSGSINNGSGGTIDGSNGGIIAFQSTLVGINNDGIITSLGPNGPAMNNAYAIDIQQTTIGAITNSGTITGGLILEDVTINGAVLNSGIIQSAQAGGDAIVIRGTTNLPLLDITNTVTGEVGVVVEGGAAIAAIFNDGVITGSSGTAIAAVGGSTIGTIFNSDTINGTVDFGSGGGIFYAQGGNFDQGTGSSSGEIMGATQIIVDVNVAGVNTATVNGDLTHNGVLAVFATAEDGLGFTSNGHLNVTGNADVTGASVLVILDTGSVTAEGDEFSFLSAGGTLTSDITVANGISADTSSSVLGFTVEQRGLELFAIAGVSDFSVPLDSFLEGAGIAGSVGGDNIENIAEALNAISLADLPSGSLLGEALGNLQGSGLTDNEKGQAIASLDPEVVEASSVGAMVADTAAAGSVNNRQTALRGDYGFSGAVAGDTLSIHGFWVQGYANETDQDVRDGVDGFDADSAGFALGLDSPISENINLGAAFTFATTDVEDKQGSKEMNIDSYRLAFYGSYNAENYYVDGQLAYAINQYETDRDIDSNLTATSLTARGDHDGDQYSFRVRAGYPIATENGWFITPKAEIDYTYLSEDNYTEKGAGNLGLSVATDDVEVLIIGIGVKFAYPISTASEQIWIPEFSLDYLYDTIGDEVEIDSNFIGVTGGGFITQGANTEQEMIKASLRVRTFGQGNLSFSGGFDYIQKDDYESQSLMATVRYDF